MNAIRALAFSIVALAGIVPGAARAQPDYEAIVRLMDECGKIKDAGARVACFDNTLETARLIASASAGSAEPPVASAVEPATPSRANAAAAPPTGFGGESLRQPEPAREAASDRTEALVRAAQQTAPGVYLLALDDGAEWRFVDAVPPSYNPPRPGSEIELRRGALGSFLMRFADQRSVRVQRVR